MDCPLETVHLCLLSSSIEAYPRAVRFYNASLCSNSTTLSKESGAFYVAQASPEDVFHVLQKQTNEACSFISNLMDTFCVAGTVEQAEQPNYLAEGQIPL
eukprot:1158088-Pelagomonas_calceolata.AAC.1